VEALERAFNEIIRRHESLRTTFDSDEGQPIQLISPSLSLKVKVVDLQHVPEPDRREHALEKVSADAHLPFNLARGPLFRANVYRLAPRQHILLMTMHHIIGDAWSVGLLMEELSALYCAFLERRDASLPDLAVQYADYAEWQREWLKSGILEKQIAFWKKHLRGAPAELALPTDRPRPASKTFQGALERRTIPLELSRKLKALAQREGVTLFMMSLAAFSVLLHRYTGQSDIVIGSPITNRTRLELERLIGFFLNTLALRADLSGSPSFREVLRRIRDVCLQAFGNQELPFERLVEELAPERNLGHNPLFQVMFVFQNEPLANRQISGLTLRPVELRSRTSKFDLTLFMEETADGMKATFEYDTDIFDCATIERMAVHFETLLGSIAAAPDLPIRRLAWLNETEQRVLIDGWNRTVAPFPAHLLAHHLFEEQAARTPDAPAAILNTDRLS
jgi:hypothetical protein